MVNMMKMMKQAADMQKNMEKLQAELAARDIDLPIVFLTGHGDDAPGLQIAARGRTLGVLQPLFDLGLWQGCVEKGAGRNALFDGGADIHGALPDLCLGENLVTQEKEARGVVAGASPH